MFIDVSENLRLSDTEKKQRREVLSRLEAFLKKTWPNCFLLEYGSSVSQLAVKESDMDVSIFLQGFTGSSDGKTEYWTANPDYDKRSDAKIVNAIGKILTNSGIENKPIPNANVPIVKLWDRGIAVDISVRNLQGWLTSAYLYDLQSIDPRVRQLILIVKEWAKCRKLNSSYEGTLSSYSLSLMCINFLQGRPNPIVPVVQMNCMAKTVGIYENNKLKGYFSEIERFSYLPEKNKETLSELVLGFFTYWAYEYNYKDDIISVRTGKVLSRREMQWSLEYGIAIEDPFDADRNVSSSVCHSKCLLLMTNFREAVDILNS